MCFAQPFLVNILVKGDDQVVLFVYCSNFALEFTLVLEKHSHSTARTLIVSICAYLSFMLLNRGRVQAERLLRLFKFLHQLLNFLLGALLGGGQRGDCP
jgi:hypothetical protein